MYSTKLFHNLKENPVSQNLLKIKKELTDIIETLNENITHDEPYNYSREQWNCPGVARDELVAEAKKVISLIEDKTDDNVNIDDKILTRYLKALEYLRTETLSLIDSFPQDVIPVYLITLNALKIALEPFLVKDNSKELAIQLKNQTKRVRSLEAILNALEPRTSPLKDMVSSIEQAHETAEQLPTDLESLREARKTIGQLVT